MVVVVVVLVAVLLLLLLPLLLLFFRRKRKNRSVRVTTPPNGAQTMYNVTCPQGTGNDGHLAAGHRWTIYVVTGTVATVASAELCASKPTGKEALNHHGGAASCQVQPQVPKISSSRKKKHLCPSLSQHRATSTPRRSPSWVGHRRTPTIGFLRTTLQGKNPGGHPSQGKTLSSHRQSASATRLSSPPQTFDSAEKAAGHSSGSSRQISLP